MRPDVSRSGLATRALTGHAERRMCRLSSPAPQTTYPLYMTVILHGQRGETGRNRRAKWWHVLLSACSMGVRVAKSDTDIYIYIYCIIQNYQILQNIERKCGLKRRKKESPERDSNQWPRDYELGPLPLRCRRLVLTVAK